MRARIATVVVFGVAMAACGGSASETPPPPPLRLAVPEEAPAQDAPDAAPAEAEETDAGE